MDESMRRRLRAAGTAVLLLGACMVVLGVLYEIGILTFFDGSLLAPGAVCAVVGMGLLIASAPGPDERDAGAKPEDVDPLDIRPMPKHDVVADSDAKSEPRAGGRPAGPPPTGPIARIGPARRRGGRGPG